MMNFNRPLILASNSPRRQELLRAVGFHFEVRTKEVNETYPPELAPDKVAIFLARKKARAYRNDIGDEIIITADTTVKLQDNILGKPANYEEARAMLSALSGTHHEVITGVCITDKNQEVVLDDVTRVWFKTLRTEEIDYYITHYQPFDKAGSYGIQECLPAGVNFCSENELNFLESIGKPELFEQTRNKARQRITAIEKIEGSYFNVVGFPIHRVYEGLRAFDQ